MVNVFQARTIAVIADLSLDEILYLFEKTRELKDALKSRDKSRADRFRIGDPDFGVYEVFLEDSTRTKESFKNAAEFHRIKLNILDAEHSSFNKNESYADGFSNLVGYENAIFIVRSKLEGVCRWLEANGARYAERHGLVVPPAFINAGDGKHEHPTQELLDEFTFLEDNNWDRSHVHLALVGDLRHGRTVHSKVDGLRIFKEVKVDLVAPPEVAMPHHYVERMRANGFEVRQFSSIREYLSKGKTNVALKWYFARHQLERMGEDVLKMQDELAEATTYHKEYYDSTPQGTLFYHPLPRDKKYPLIPPFLDGTPLNGWERQSANGKPVRINLIGMIAGKLGDDFAGRSLERETYIDDFMEEVPVSVTDYQPKENKEGVNPITDGIVIDHICRGEDDKQIREHIPRIIRVVGLYGRGGEWVDRSQRGNGHYKGIIFRPGFRELNEKEIKLLAAVAPGCTLNVIKGGRAVRKIRLSTPPTIQGSDELSCSNKDCISHPQHYEGVQPEFYREGKDTFVCRYCETPHTFKRIWK